MTPVPSDVQQPHQPTDEPTDEPTDGRAIPAIVTSAIIVDADPRARGVASVAARLDDPPLDYLLRLWLAEQGSTRTQRDYATTLADYRRWLRGVGLDLDCGEHARLAEVATSWSQRLSEHPTQAAHRGRPPSRATQARRVAIVSSFFAFGLQHDMREWRRDGTTGVVTRADLDANPMRKVKRVRVQRYAEAQPLDAHDLVARLRAIDRATLLGKRDFALLLVAVMTGRRLSELASLTMRSLTLTRGGAITIRVVAKRGKVMRDRLDTRTAVALRGWLCAAYGVNELRTSGPDALPATAPVWLALSRSTTTYEAQAHHGQRQPLSRSGIRDVFMTRLGTSKVHAGRHTAAVLMEQAGAPLSQIQGRLGHASSATTAEYLNALHSAENPYIDRVAALLSAAGLD